jgi:alanine dehydrogenase
VLLGGVPGVEPADVVVIGGGVVGTNAAKIAAGLGARVTILDNDLYRLRYLDDVMPKNVTTMMSNPYNIRKTVTKADLVIGGVLIHGAKAPKLVTKEMLKEMKQGSVIVDVDVDQGGCVETCHPTTHENPTYVWFIIVLRICQVPCLLLPRSLSRTQHSLTAWKLQTKDTQMR